MTIANTAAVAVRPTAAVHDFAADMNRLTREITTWLAGNWLQVAIALAIGAAIVLALLGLRSLGGRLCRGHDESVQWRTIVGRAITRTRMWFMVALAARLVEGGANTPAGVTAVITAVFTIAAALQAALWAREIILGFVEHRAAGDTEKGAIGSALGIIRLLVTFALFAIAGVLILDNLGVNVTGLIAGLGIGGIAIGLAAQGIFADLFAALAIIFDKPFRRGDAVSWDSTSGSVERIGLKSTRIRSITGEQIIVSNKNLLDKELRNLARLDRRRMTLAIGVIYQTPVDVCRAIPNLLRTATESVDKCVVVRTGMTAFGASSLDYELQFDVRSEVWDVVYAARHAVCIAILDTFTREGIEFAYPTQLNFTGGPDGRAVFPT
ncbi:mechanosensitive ion channel family protein [Sphingomonas prati]|uniref:Small-conductance mechanosensitive channel n=1 Tax=Sphingomonas prati TaxID=1843237 RepID=A0A7W9BU24_9SPHN|nr:mechanosensitive ion channel domain-containing protein [Sphingomonas prati]MBB5730131.1 small-conductance mechanosensitive channel [Sphingomonas prati]GGE91719.1 mechanosensitive ion channel protein MscS [Sphingomonas prati]